MASLMAIRNEALKGRLVESVDGCTSPQSPDGKHKFERLLSVLQVEVVVENMHMVNDVHTRSSTRRSNFGGLVSSAKASAASVAHGQHENYKAVYAGATNAVEYRCKWCQQLCMFNDGGQAKMLDITKNLGEADLESAQRGYEQQPVGRLDVTDATAAPRPALFTARR